MTPAINATPTPANASTPAIHPTSAVLAAAITEVIAP